MHEGCQEISRIKANESARKSNLRNHRNLKLSDSADNHDSVKAFGFSGTTTQPTSHDSVTQTTQKQKNKYEVKPQYEELSKQLNMQHAINQCYECMMAIKDRIARPASRLEIISIEPLYHAQQVSRWKSSVRDLQSPSAHHSSVVFRHNRSVGHHSDDSIGLFRHNKSVGKSQRGSQSGHQSICQAQYENNETDFSKKLRTPVATRFHSNANSGLQMGSNRKSNSQRIQRHQNHSNHRRRTTAIDGNRSR
ncbi:pumilio10-like [Dorcoceras hygrometricum]|uniref:Pumilio10-like n=1 Tax=Dorcoceras hygrometricum TaxID=472368 RepID=A0A2Z7BBB4_9LAMI|nr:pumilio10-like [Dorcoceras hygrometricum]